MKSTDAIWRFYAASFSCLGVIIDWVCNTTNRNVKLSIGLGLYGRISHVWIPWRALVQIIFRHSYLSNSIKEISDWIKYSLSFVLPVWRYLFSKKTSSRQLRMYTAFHAERQNVFSFNPSLCKRWDKVVQWTGTDRLFTSFFPENYSMPKHGYRTLWFVKSEMIIQHVLRPKMHLILFATRKIVSVQKYCSWTE